MIINEDLHLASYLIRKSGAMETDDEGITAGGEGAGTVGATVGIVADRIPYNNGYGDMSFGRLIDRNLDRSTARSTKDDMKFYSNGSNGVTIASQDNFKRSASSRLLY